VIESASAAGAPTPHRSEDPFRFLLGHVRSGTTMLRAMLDSHPALAVPPESYFVPTLLGDADAPLDLGRFCAQLDADEYFADWQVATAEVRTALDGDPRVTTRADAVAGLYALYATRHGKPQYADKTPSHLLHVPLLAGRFPRARFVHIVRDGRDVAASLVTMGFGASDFAEAARGWRRKVLKAHAAGTALGPERYRLVHYEDLVRDPEPTLRGICEFFDLDYAPPMLAYHERADELLEGLRHTGHVQGIRQPPTRALRDWRLDLTPAQIAAFDEVAGTALEALGYERSGLRRSVRARVTAVTVELRVLRRRTWRLYRKRVVRKVRSYLRVRA
jgi:hypothetical protein